MILHPGIEIRIGSHAHMVQATNAAVDNPHPYVEWSVPASITQRRFSIKISNIESPPLGWAYTTSGEQYGDHTCFRFPTGIQLNDNFRGLCQVELAISEQTTGDFEWSAQPLYFVYDRNKEALHNADQIELSWLAAHDPDTAPSTYRTYEVQIASDISFEDMLYYNTAVNVGAAAKVSLLIPPEEFDPIELSHKGVDYFWRVRSFDGLDFSSWSPVNVFTNYGNLAPRVKILDIKPLGTIENDYEISFELEDANGDAASVELSFVHDEQTIAQPCRSSNCLAHLPVGVHKVVWHVRREQPLELLKNIIVYAIAYDGNLYGPQDAIGPIDIDLRSAPSGGMGSTEYHYAAKGHLATITEQSIDPVLTSAHGRFPGLVEETWYDGVSVGEITEATDSESHKPVNGRIDEHQIFDRPSEPIVGGIRGLPAPIDISTEQWPASGRSLREQIYQPGQTTSPTGSTRPPREIFWTAGWDVASSGAHSVRPSPSQKLGIGLQGKIGRYYQTWPLAFRFLPGNWDAFITVHWQMTASSTTYSQLQYAPVMDGGVHGTWRTVAADNSQIDAITGMLLVNPTVFHAYWPTRNTSDFVDQQQYQLRLRAYDSKNQRFTAWVYSSVFVIDRTASNPVSILSTTYEPWERQILITLRLDSSSNYEYDLNAFWFSDNDGQEWKPIPPGDITGNLRYLSSTPGKNIHNVRWKAGSHDLQPGNDYRIRIDAIPSYATEGIEQPQFKWLVPTNPGLDIAETQLAQLIGHTQRHVYNPESEEWIVKDPPAYIPGRIDLLENERRTVYMHGTNSSPEGLLSFAAPSPSGDIVIRELDEEGNRHDARYEITSHVSYQQWLSEEYQSGITHHQRLIDIGIEIDNITQHSIPQLQGIIIDCQKATRQDLIDQGYYAESHFKDINGQIEEMVDIAPIFEEGSNTPNRQVSRHWRFRVESVARGLDAIYNDDGFYDPSDMTSLETVFYRFQLDPAHTFDSQPNNKPLRDIILDSNGRRLSIAHSATASSDTMQVGGQIKLAANQFPGNQSDDNLPDNMADWTGNNYYWRVAAYNAFQGPVLSRPRPYITNQQEIDGSLVVQYRADSHPNIQTASVTYYTRNYRQIITGYEISTQTTQPFWTDLQALNFVSDRRASIGSETEGHNPPWVVQGTDRAQPYCVYDHLQNQYLVFFSKKDTQGRWRIASARSMTLPEACEYDMYFVNHTAEAIFAPCLVRIGDLWHLYVGVIESTGCSPRIAVSTSTDAHRWSDLVILDEIEQGTSPCVVVDGDTVYMWFESVVDESVVIKHATSDNGVHFTVSETPAKLDASQPSVVRQGSEWLMFYGTPGGSVLSAVSSDGLDWIDIGIEFDVTQLEVDGQVVLGTPCNTCAFWDLYRGNYELFVMFNYLLPNGEHVMKLVRREDRIWRNGDPNGIFAMPGNLVGVTFGKGEYKSFTVDRTSNSIPTGELPKVRINFTNWQPDNIEYRRQSQWSSPSFTADGTSVWEPWPWFYHPLLNGEQNV